MAHQHTSARVRADPRGMNANDWIFTPEDIRASPSAREGMAYRAEIEQRSKGANFIIQVGMKLRLPQMTLNVATTLFHRFYMRFSLKRYHHYEIGATCLFLAVKTEETGRKLQDIVVACCRVARKDDKLLVDEQSKDFWRWKDVILFREELLLEALCFDLYLENPFDLLNRYMRTFSLANTEGLSKSACAFINDSCRTTLCLQHPPKVIAAAALHCAITMNPNSKIPPEPGTGRQWYDQVGVSMDEITSACGIITEVYDTRPKPDAAKGDKTEKVAKGEPKPDAPRPDRAERPDADK
ncbi:cyclin-like protein [Dipodascopsis tothii]|uniref:cyclin-like protein n=1 Tax=Dipodascopsis tothii TaxID=44089 RepID=UPI0034CF1CD4